LSSTSGVPLWLTAVPGAAQGLPEARQGGDGPHDRMSHPSLWGDRHGDHTWELSADQPGRTDLHLFHHGDSLGSCQPAEQGVN
jgi:hypothetical protein